MKNIFRAILIMAALLCGVVHANGSLVTLGAGSDCTYDTLQGDTLQDVLNLTPSEVRLVNNVSYVGQFVATAGVKLRGGYASCADAANDTQGNNNAVLDGNFQGITLTLLISGAYELEKISIINGSNPTDRGGGLLLSGMDMSVLLDQVTVENNEANYGGGIFKGSNLNVLLVIKDSVIKGNYAGFTAGLGGGMYFDLGGELVVYGDTQITENEAISGGGGVYLDDAVATFVGGINASINSGISFNKSASYAGGLYARGSTVHITGGVVDIPGIGLIGEAGKNFNVFLNESVGSGGGLYFDLASNATLEAVSIVSNKSTSNHGGGMMVNNNSALSMGRPENSGCQITTSLGCNFFAQNTANLQGGGLYVWAGAQVNLQSVNFNNNRANAATAAFVTGAGSKLIINASVFHDNGNLGAGGFNDQHVMRVTSSAELEITHSTAVKNRATLGFIVNSSATFKAFNNYFFNHQTGPWLLNGGTAQSDYLCQLVDSNNNIADAANYLSLTTLSANDAAFFVDEANNDYHLSDSSVLLDYTGTNCPVNSQVDGNLSDIDGDPRTPLSADLGADENLSNDIIFVDGFE